MLIQRIVFLVCMGVCAYADSIDNIIANNTTLNSKDKNQVLSIEKSNNQTVNNRSYVKKSENEKQNILYKDTNPSKIIKVIDINKAVTNPQTIDKGAFSNLNSIDNDSNDINQLNRKLQLEKIAAEIKKLKNNTPAKINNREIMDDAQTTVSGVAINEDGKKTAWLQFADGGSLMVNVDSKVGNYIVSDITMTGVILSNTTGTNKYIKKIVLKRLYASSINNKKSSNISSTNGSTFFTPSPILTGANSNDENVPSIIPTRSKY